MKYHILLAILFFSFIGNAQNRILVDGDFDEWSGHATVYSDDSGDGGSSGIDFGKAKIFNDADYLFLSLEVGSEINLQDLNEITIYVDIDDNVSTGLLKNGIGADVEYTFGNRSGRYHPSSGSAISIRHRDIGMITAPTVTSDRFEMAFKRVFTINGNAVVLGQSVKVLFTDNEASGDALPSENGGLSYSFSNGQLDALPSFSLKTKATSDLRMVSYNVERDGLFETSRVPAYKRLFAVMKPDIIGFQEIYNHTSSEVADHIESMLVSPAGEKWHHAMAEPDCHAISRFPILKSVQIPGVNGSGNGAFLIDLPAPNLDMLLIVAHPPCCSNNVGRQEEVDQIMQFVREAKEGNGPIQLQTDAPIVILGDMNFVGDRNQVSTILTGDISDEASYGSDFTPDWDGSDLMDSRPSATGVPFNFTWYSESSAFSPGRLDYVFYSGSNLTLDNSYSLFTPGLPTDTLTKYGLLADDAVIASDHLPLVADFSLESETSQVINPQQEFNGFNVYPNPAQNIVEISFTSHAKGSIGLHLLDGAGKQIATLHADEWTSGEYSTRFNVVNYPSGNYLLKLVGADDVYYQKLVILH